MNESGKEFTEREEKHHGREESKRQRQREQGFE